MKKYMTKGFLVALLLVVSLIGTMGWQLGEDYTENKMLRARQESTNATLDEFRQMYADAGQLVLREYLSGNLQASNIKVTRQYNQDARQELYYLTFPRYNCNNGKVENGTMIFIPRLLDTPLTSEDQVAKIYHMQALGLMK